MGIFDEERKRMAAATGGQVRSEQQRQAELNAIARKVSEDLLKDFGNKIEVSVSGNRIILQGRPGNTLEIACEGRNTFGLKETSGFQQVAGQPRGSTHNAQAINQSEMARHVIAWQKEQGAA